MDIRLAQIEDAEAIREIYNKEVTSGQQLLILLHVLFKSRGIG